MHTINNLTDLTKHFSADAPSSLNRRLYKDTDCGASISVYGPGGAWHAGDDWSALDTAPGIATGFTIQTIVEGSDATVDSNLFTFPVASGEVDAWIDSMEREAAYLWDRDNSNHYHVRVVATDFYVGYAKETWGEWTVDVDEENSEHLAEDVKVFGESAEYDPDADEQTFTANGQEYQLVRYWPDVA